MLPRSRDHPILPHREDDGNEPNREDMTNIATMVMGIVERTGDRPAIVERDRVATYAALARRAGAASAALTADGVTPGDRVVILLERSADAAAAFFGAVGMGAIAINANETLRPRQVEHILGHSGAKILVTSPELLDRQPRPIDAPQTLFMNDISEGERFDPVSRRGSDVAQIIYTSGSTGLPKGVTITHDNLWAGTEAVTTYLGLEADDRIASLLPFSFDYGFNQLLCAISLGATLVVERSPVPQRIVASLRQHEATVLPAVPPLWLQLLGVKDFTDRAMKSLRVMTNTGGRLPVAAVRRLRQAQPQAKLFLMYGLTEAFRSTYLPPEEVDRRPDSIGKAIPGAEILVLNERNERCAPGEPGELVHRGPTVALGYWNDAEATAKVYRPNPTASGDESDAERVVFSGDLVRRDDEGFLYFVGRRDKMIKSLGFRVSPDEVSEVLHASGEVLEAAVGSEPDERWGERVVAYVVLRPEGSLDRLQQFCGRELPRYMQPGRIVVLPDLPRTATGKYDLESLRSSA